MRGSRQKIPGRSVDGLPYWKLTVDLPSDPATGKRRRSTRGFRGSARDADRALAQFRREVEERLAITRDGTVAQLLEEWIAQVGSAWSPTTLDRNEQIIRTHILPALGPRPLSKLTTYDVDALYRAVAAKGRAPATCRKVHTVLHAALRQGVRWGWLVANPADKDHATAPKVVRGEVRAPTVEQVQALMEAAERLNPDVGCFVRLAATTGARRGELCGVRWGDFIFDADGSGALRIMRGVVKGKGVVIVKSTKTEHGRRIDLDPATVLDVQLQMERVRARATAAVVNLVDDPFLFGSGFLYAGGDAFKGIRLDGSAPWRPDYPTRTWQVIRASVGLPDVSMRSLRHFTATQLLAAGIDVKTVQRRLGHSRGAMTMDVYSAFIEGTDRAAATLMAERLRRPETQTATATDPEAE